MPVLPLAFEDLVEGVDLPLCANTARVMAARINEWEPMLAEESPDVWVYDRD